MKASLTASLAATAARLVVEEGLEYDLAKRKAARAYGKHGARTVELPSDEDVEHEVRAYIALYCAETQPYELAALRALAKQWMERLAAFRPHLTGAVWRGTATRRSNVDLELFCDDPKSAEIALIGDNINYTVAPGQSHRGFDADVLLISSPCPALGEPATLALRILDRDDLRGALRPDTRGRTVRGDLSALRKLEANV